MCVFTHRHVRLHNACPCGVDMHLPSCGLFRGSLHTMLWRAVGGLASPCPCPSHAELCVPVCVAEAWAQAVSALPTSWLKARLCKRLLNE